MFYSYPEIYVEHEPNLSSHYLPLICEGRRDVTAISLLYQGVVGVSGANLCYLSGRGQGTPWTSRQLIAGLLLMAEVPTAHQEQFWGSVSCSRILRHTAPFHPGGVGIRTTTCSTC